jgi:hypothetical protein
LLNVCDHENEEGDAEESIENSPLPKKVMDLGFHDIELKMVDKKIPIEVTE